MRVDGTEGIRNVDQWARRQLVLDDQIGLHDGACDDGNDASDMPLEETLSKELSCMY